MRSPFGASASVRRRQAHAGKCSRAPLAPATFGLAVPLPAKHGSEMVIRKVGVPEVLSMAVSLSLLDGSKDLATQSPATTRPLKRMSRCV